MTYDLECKITEYANDWKKFTDLLEYVCKESCVIYQEENPEHWPRGRVGTSFSCGNAIVNPNPDIIWIEECKPKCIMYIRTLERTISCISEAYTIKDVIAKLKETQFKIKNNVAESRKKLIEEDFEGDE